MCDDLTEAENEAYLKRLELNRRQWSLGAGATVASVLAGCGPSPASTSSASPGEEPTPSAPEQATTQPAGASGRMVTITTPDGEAEAFFATPGEGRHPAVLIWPDIAGLRDAFQAMATRLAGHGYAVLAVNHYYRSSKVPVLSSFAEWRTEEGRAKIKPMREALTSAAIASDGAAFVAWLDQQPQVDPARKIGTTGYCMGGPFTVRTAAAAPDRVGAIGSFHGGGLVSEEDDSPHALFAKMKAAALICIAQNDHERSPDTQAALQKAAEAANLPAEIEVYPAQHGWCVPDSPVYDEQQAERAWTRLLATFEAHL